MPWLIHSPSTSSDEEPPQLQESSSSDDSSGPPGLVQHSSSSSSDSMPSLLGETSSDEDPDQPKPRSAMKGSTAQTDAKIKKIKFSWQALSAARRQERNPSPNVIQTPKWDKRGVKVNVPLCPDLIAKNDKRARLNAWEEFKCLV